MTALATNARPTLSAQGHLPLALVGAAIVLAAVFVQVLSAANPDVSWLLTLGERWLAGDRPYVDFIEVNPPASIIAYVPAILIGQGLGIAPEIVVDILVVCGGVASLAVTWRILDRVAGTSVPHSALVAGLALALLLIVPTGTFAEREHLAVLAMLPMLAATAVRAQRGSLPVGLTILVGVGGSLAVILKPLFVLALVGPGLDLLVRRGFRAVATAWEFHVAAVASAAYGVAVPLLFPAFTNDILTWAVQAYVPARYSLPVLLFSPVTLVWAGLLCALPLVGPERRLREVPRILALASLGFETVFLIQGKNWPYHAMPGILLLGLAILMQAAVPWPQGVPLQNRLAWVLVGVLGVLAARIFAINSPISATMPELAAAIERLAPHPRMMAISSDIAVGHPLVREVSGRWVGTFCSEWATQGMLRQKAAGATPAALARLTAISDREKAIVAQDIRGKAPDVVLIQDGWLDYARSTPALTAALAAYRPVETHGILTIWLRKDLASPAQP